MIIMQKREALRYVVILILSTGVENRDQLRPACRQGRIAASNPTMNN